MTLFDKKENVLKSTCEICKNITFTIPILTEAGKKKICKKCRDELFQRTPVIHLD